MTGGGSGTLADLHYLGNVGIILKPAATTAVIASRCVPPGSTAAQASQTVTYSAVSSIVSGKLRTTLTVTSADGVQRCTQYVEEPTATVSCGSGIYTGTAIANYTGVNVVGTVNSGCHSSDEWK